MRRAVPTVDVVTFETAPQALVALQQRKAVGFVNDEHHLTPMFVLCEQGPVESMGQFSSIIGALREAQFPADQLEGIV